MKKLIFVILSIFLFSCEKNDPNENIDRESSMIWEKTFGGNLSDFFRSAEQTQDGGYIATGYTGSNRPGNDGWLIKTDQYGNEQWNQTYGGSDYDRIHSFERTTDGGYVLAGYTESFGAGYQDGWLIKTDENGNENWSQTFGESDADYFNSVKQTTDGGFIIAGRTASYIIVDYNVIYNEDGWLIKTDENGNEQWSQTFGGYYADYFHSVQQTKDGGYILAGITFSSEVSLHGDGWLVKTDGNGNEQWSRNYGGTEYDRINSVEQTTDGGYILVGHTSSFGGDGWLIKTDENGNEQWSQTYGGSGSDYLNFVYKTIDGGYILAGTTSSFEDTSYGDGWLIKTDEFGNEQWSQTFGGSDADYLNSVKQTTDGGYIAAGAFRSYDVNISPGGEPSGPFYDGWLIKTDENGNLEE